MQELWTAWYVCAEHLEQSGSAMLESLASGMGPGTSKWYNWLSLKTLSYAVSLHPHTWKHTCR